MPLDPMPPKKEATSQKSVRLSESEWARVEAVVAETEQNISDVMRHFALWALEAVDRRKAGELHAEAERVLAILRETDPELADRIRSRVVAELRR